MRHRPRSLAVLALVAMLLVPASALAQGSTTPLTQTTSPLSPFVPAPAPTPTTPTVITTSNTSTSAGGFTSTDAILIGIGALVVLGGIWMYIWRDARRRAPNARRRSEADLDGGPRHRQKSRKLSPAEKKRRKRGKARR